MGSKLLGQKRYCSNKKMHSQMNRVLQVASIVIAAIEEVEPFEHPRIDPSDSYQDTVVVLQKIARQLSL